MATNGFYPQNGSAVMPPTGKFKPTVGLPQIVALAAVTGEMVSSQFGESEVKLMLTNGQPWYVAQAMADAIRTSGIQPRQQLEVTKTGKGPMDWKIVPLQAHLGGAPAAAPPQTVVAGTPAAAQPLATSQQTQHSAPKSQLAACFEQACDAIKGAQAYANSIGLGITFTSEDVRSTAISACIGCQKGGSR